MFLRPLISAWNLKIYYDLIQSFNNTLRTLYDQHAPIKKKAIITRRRVPWFNDTIKQAKRSGRNAERK